VAEFVADLRDRKVTPHVAQNTANRRSAIDGRTTRHAGYPVSQQVRKRIEEGFGWTKTTAGFRKTRHRGLARVGWMFTLTATAYNLIRLPKLLSSVAVVTPRLCPGSAQRPQKPSRSTQKPVPMTDSLQLTREFCIGARRIAV
jgi:hypothetical protein